MNEQQRPMKPLTDTPEAVQSRLAVIQALGPAFRSVGKLLWVGGSLIGGDRVSTSSPFGHGSDAVVGLAIVAQTAGELCSGADLLLEHRNSYGAAALVRQLVEVEYLAWAFAEDEREAESWLRASRSERLKRWQPRQIRDRSGGRFRGIDYQFHCDVGGHPTREGAQLLPDHTQMPSSLLAADLAVHAVSAWAYLQAALRRNGYDSIAGTSEAHALDAAIEQWRSQDSLASMFYEPDAQADG